MVARRFIPWRSAGPLAIVVALGLMVAGCGGGSSNSGAGGSASRTASSNKVVASVPASALVQKGHLTICSDIPYAPKEFYDSNGNLKGSDVDLGNTIAARLGLKPLWENSVFDTIIEALESGKCDVIISAMGITPARSKQIAQIPDGAGGQTFLVNKGNPDHIGDITKNPLVLCGLKVSVELGTVEQTELQDDYAKKCASAGKPPIEILSAAKADTTVEQLLTHKSQVLFQDEAPNAYLVEQQPKEFEILGGSVFVEKEGIGVVKSNTVLQNAIKKALRSMAKDGVVKKIDTKWHMGDQVLPNGE